jgi:hypothetical protein
MSHRPIKKIIVRTTAQDIKFEKIIKNLTAFLKFKVLKINFR